MTQALIEWRNANAVPVGSVRADITAYNAFDTVTYRATDREIFRAETDGRRVRPDGERLELLSIEPQTAGEPTRIEVTISRVEADAR